MAANGWNPDRRSPYEIQLENERNLGKRAGVVIPPKQPPKPTAAQPVQAAVQPIAPSAPPPAPYQPSDFMSGKESMPANNIASLRSQFFSNKRDEVNRQANAAGQAQQDALARRFTAIGQGTGSGAAIGAQMQANQMAENTRRAALGDVNAAESGALMQSTEADVARDFQRKLAGEDMRFKRGMFDVEQGNKLKELDLAQKNYELERDAQDFNKHMAQIEAGREPGGLLGGGGILGTGLGGKKGFLGTGLLGDEGPLSLGGAVGGGLAHSLNPVLAPIGAVLGGGGK